MTKLNLRIQTLIKINAKFQKDADKIVGGGVFTRKDSDRQTHRPKV